MGMAPIGEVMLREIEEIPQVLERITNNFEADTKAKSLLTEKKFDSVIILARGTSDNAAHFLKYLIETKLGIACGLASPSAATLYSAKLLYEKTLVIAISQSGQSTDLVLFAKAAKAGGGYLLSVTNDPESPLAKLADHHIPILAGPEIAVPATKSYVGQMMISYLLVESWIDAEPSSQEVIARAREILAQQDLCIEFAKKIEIKRPLFILGRGFSYPNAKEFALKLQETCLVPVQGMSSSDFLHGPIASVSTDTQVIFMSPEHLPGESFGESAERIRTKSKNLFWIGASNKSQQNEPVLTGPASSSEVTASITDAIFFQRVTHFLATSNGLDPDSPAGLNKVTITR